MLTQDEIEDLIIRLLAEKAGRPPEELRAELEQLGGELPVDSILAVEVLAKVQEACGVRLTPNAETARAMRSVRAYAGVVWDLVQQQREGRASA